ncbi:MAG: magnesium/cobalt transporter CorA [Planctomycetes bacterium]|nr:magnesium/cobalt transporter CorA [Planctomycetota bacterium]
MADDVQDAADAELSEPVRRRGKPGSSPGTLHIDPAAPKPVLRVMAYGPDRLREQTLDSAHAVRALLGQEPVTWINVDGLGDAGVLQELAAIFGIHRLALEDVVHVYQRAKVEPYADHHFVIARMPHLDGRLATEQISFFVGRTFVLTFQEQEGDCFDLVRERVREQRGRLRSAGPDYLLYALLDAIIDAYFPVLEAYGERLDEMEDEVIAAPRHDAISRIQDVKRDLLALRRAVWPLREAVNTLVRDDSEHFHAETRIHLRDCYDHTVQVLDMVETYRELGSGLLEIHLSSLSHRMNEVMKVLTIIATIFIPLTFIAGVYGMNFNPASSPWNMPELSWYWGYPFFLVLMLVVAVVLLLMFRSKGWIEFPRRRRRE